MIQISFPWMIEVAAALDNLDQIKPGQTLAEAFLVLFEAKSRLEGAYQQSIYIPFLRASREPANRLHGAIADMMTPFDAGKILDETIVWRIKVQRDQFKLVFLADVSLLPAFLVTRKDNYDVQYLISEGVGLFPPPMLTKAPETKDDALEVGKCLAFERNTACGFHTFRVVEAVARRYWDAVSGGKARPVPETLGMFAGQLKICQMGDAKVYESLEQMTKLHRNPLAHPDVILDADEAIAVVGMARSVLTPMLGVLPDVPPTTGALSPTQGP